MKEFEQKEEEKQNDKFVEDIDFYFEDGFMVLTEHFLLKRGYCCDNKCRHCPYPKTGPAKSQ